ncbi:cytochrome P450 [Halosimplex amylolyticum]|uniref:cytochrome P450 n=1 Tax=Halosimplex amylolyticum TaxID=3396616 RepID=UPI003F55F316
MGSANRPPTPDGVPLMGHGWAFARDPWTAMREWAERGAVVELSFPGRSMYMVTDPQLVERVLVADQDRFTLSRAQRQTFAGIEDHAVTASTGERWKRLRRALQPAFEWDGVRSYGDRMAERTAAHVDDWDPGDRLDLWAEMRRLTLHVLGDTLLGVDVEGEEAVIHEAADALVAKTDFRRPGQLLPDWVPTPTQRRFERAVGALDEYIEGVIADSSPEPAGDSVVGVLLAARERGDLSPAEVRDNLTALFLAGHDSSAVTLTYAWYELGRHPEVRERLVAEVDGVFDGELPGADDFDDLDGVRTVVDETLRLYPPAFATSREATDPVTIGGYDLPAGAQLMLPQWVLHRDERYWEDPDTFDPARWERDADRPEYAYFPFSGGPRHCIGMRFARLELVIALATMVDRVDLDVSVDGPLTFTPSLSLRPENDVRATVRTT